MTAPVAVAATLPPTVVTGAVSSIRPTSVTLHGSVNPNGAATTWYFQYGPNTTLTSSTPIKSAGSKTSVVSVSQSISGLSPATSYDYRLVATNSVGTTFGPIGIFNTTAAPSVVTGAASNVSVQSAMLNGTVNTQALATNWYFQYGLSTVYGSKTPTMKLVASPNPSNVSASVTGLLSRTVYHFRIVATNSAGKSYGADLSFSTGQAVTLNTSTSVVVYGKHVTLSGVVASAIAGESVMVESEGYNQSAFSGVAIVQTGAGGVWSLPVVPPARTTYMAVVSEGSSSPIVVSVRPLVTLTKISGGRLRSEVVAAVPFAGHVLQLQMLSHNAWVTWKHVRLNSKGRVVFTTRLPAGVRMIRMAIAPFVLGIDQAAPGYLAGFSRAIRY